MDPANDRQMELLMEAQAISDVVWECEQCDRAVKGPLPGFPVWWQAVSYNWRGDPYCPCGGAYRIERQMN